MVEVLEVKQGVWIDETLIKLAGLGTRLRIVTQPGEIRLVPATESVDRSRAAWLAFVNETYGCLADDPIMRGEQGAYEVKKP